jgi:hypothetical protein
LDKGVLELKLRLVRDLLKGIEKIKLNMKKCTKWTAKKLNIWLKKYLKRKSNKKSLNKKEIKKSSNKLKRKIK